MAKNNNREKILSSMSDYDEKISKCEEELKNLSYKRQILLARTIESEMKMRHLDLRDFYNQMDKFDENNTQQSKQKETSAVDNTKFSLSEKSEESYTNIK